MFALALAGPAAAATKANLAATDNTVAGPGVTSVTAGGTERIFSNPNMSDVCVTVVNTGKLPIGVSIVGASSASSEVPVGGSTAVCSDDTTAIDLTCTQDSKCAAQWRVDDN
jgi:hypothetical protein